MAQLDQYLDTLQPMARGKADKALNRQMRLDGRYMWRWQAAETLASRGVRVDHDRGRVWLADNAFYDVSAITRTACDYIEWLQARSA